MTTAVFYHSPDLPWTISPEERRRFQRILTPVVVITLICSLVFPFLPVPDKAKDAVEPLPPRYARMLLTPKPAPPKPVVKPKPELPKVEPTKTEHKAPTPEAKKPPVPVAPAPKPKPSARERASHAGLLAFREDLASLRSNVAIPHNNRPLQKAAAAEAPKVERALITRRAEKGTKGIDTAKLSRDTGNKPAAAAHRTEQVASEVLPVATQRPGTHGQDGLPTRSDEEIQLVFDRNKGKLYSLYNRALRTNAGLRGKVVLLLSIASDGKVLKCEIVSSELKDAKLEKQLVTRIRMFDFGALDVVETQVTYPIDFFPS
ncbi:MAG: AgmX/PglI C-terminal domain-containing protein [Gammaproteobacteria bacterium]|nr:AgmX/PglI C-terminal domain-containing protein [Gammaproteobacteria bacterium]